MINAVIIDDEPEARDLLENMLNMVADDFQVSGKAEGVAKGIALIQNTSPDMVFLDIQMGDGTGIDLIRELKTSGARLPLIVFVTAFQDYAIQAFEFSATDYLLKPITPERLSEAAEKVRNAVNANVQSVQIQTLLSNFNPGVAEKHKKIVLKTSESVFAVDVQDIIRCESEGNYTTFVLNDGRVLLVSKIIKYYEGLLEPYGFFRTHQSHLVNLDFFEEYLRRDEQIRMKNGDLIPLASRKKEPFLELLGNL